jgi:hypothetical protein
VKYIALGVVRGPCGHTHDTIREAAYCTARDNAALREAGGPKLSYPYHTDRVVMYEDGGELATLDEQEEAADWESKALRATPQEGAPTP